MSLFVTVWKSTVWSEKMITITIVITTEPSISIIRF